MKWFLQNASAPRLFLAALLTAATMGLGILAFVKVLEVGRDLFTDKKEKRTITCNPIAGKYVHTKNRDEFLAFAGRQDIGILSFGREVESGDMHILAGITNVQRLICREAKIKDDDLKYVSGLGKLETLRLHYVPVGDEGMVHVNKIKSLMQLGLMSTAVTDAGLKKLTALENLQELWLSGDFDGSGLPSMNLSKLKVLALMHKKVTDKALEVLPGCPELMEVSLYDTSVTNAGLKTLTRCQKLISLDLRNTGVTDDGIMVLARLKGLKYLTVCETAVTRAGVRQLQRELPDCQIKYGKFDAPDDGDVPINILLMEVFVIGAILIGALLGRVIDRTPARTRS